ncbi:MAG: AEC family transporter, partial [Candidatus Hodarchaeota archaeon]
IIFCVCYIIAVYYSPREGEKVHLRLIAKKVITSPPLLAYIIALLFNGFNLSFPWLVQEIVGVIAKANHFITYLVLGIYLNLKLEKHHWLKIFKVLGTRYGVGLGLGLLFYFILPINELARTVLLICYIIPVGMALLVYVVQYDYNENFAGMLSNLNIIISFGLMWFILFLINL